ncbi:MAG TPA: tryptophan--tRNA ligase [Thermomicrobiales bacterium]|nr:tryptophan--tRNA ligase [Thermomicrobiales bacterium]
MAATVDKTSSTETRRSGPRAFSGIQPSGNLHLGNYLGAIRNWVLQQDEYDSVFSIVDLHALSLATTRESMQSNIRNLANTIVAAGVDPGKAVLFVQSDVREHAELCWLLGSVTQFGELRRMTQFKDKAGEHEEGVSAALFVYPVLQVADIILYDANKVPVGEDQKQHIELTRDVAYRFNQRYGETFVLPEPDIKTTGARIMALDDPTKKMSKSSPNQNSYIALNDEPDVIRKKIRRAVTDSGSEIVAGRDKPALTNLMSIYAILSDNSLEGVSEKFIGKGYGPFKQELGEVVVDALAPIQRRLRELEESPEIVDAILAEGAEEARTIASAKMRLVRERMGLGGAG